MVNICLEKHLALNDCSFCPLISPVQLIDAELKLDVDIVSIYPPVQTAQHCLTFALITFIWFVPFKRNKGFYFLHAVSKVTPQTESLRNNAIRTKIVGIKSTCNAVFPHGNIGEGIKELIALITAHTGLDVKTRTK